MCFLITIKILNIGRGRSQQIVQTQIRLLLEEQSDQSQHCCSSSSYVGCITGVLIQTVPYLGQHQTTLVICSGVPIFVIFTISLLTVNNDIFRSCREIKFC